MRGMMAWPLSYVREGSPSPAWTATHSMGGGTRGDILFDEVYRPLLERATNGEFLAIIAAPPCSTFSISRFMHSSASPDGGPPVVRTREHIDGLPSPPPGHARETAPR